MDPEDKLPPLQMGKLRPGEGKRTCPQGARGKAGMGIRLHPVPAVRVHLLLRSALGLLLSLTSLPLLSILSPLPLLSEPCEAPFQTILALVEGWKPELGRKHPEVQQKELRPGRSPG